MFISEDRSIMDEPTFYQIVAFRTDGNRIVLKTFFDRHQAEKEYELTRLALQSGDKSEVFLTPDCFEIELQAVYRD